MERGLIDYKVEVTQFLGNIRGADLMECGASCGETLIPDREYAVYAEMIGEHILVFKIGNGPEDHPIVFPKNPGGGGFD